MGPSRVRASRTAAWAVLTGALYLLALSPSARAYIPTVTPGGRPVLWGGNPLHLNFAGNPDNSSGLPGNEVFAAFVRGLQRWQTASGGSLGFDYWQGSDKHIYAADSSFNGLNSIYFASNTSPDRAGDTSLTPNVLGLTQVWYDTTSGQILETDIVLNDVNFHFTTDERDTSGYGTGMHAMGEAGSKPHVFIDNVITHELGHALGLSHSGGLQSTMLFMESPEQAHLGCDEQIAVHALYPSGDGGQRGGMGGQVVTESGGALFGAHVVAISRARGTVLATGITGRDGRYRISALEPGSYFLMVEPYFAGPAPLPAFYASIRDEVCTGHAFGRSFLTNAAGDRLKPVVVPPGGSVEAPPLVARCGNEVGAAVRSLGAQSAVALSDSAGFGIADRFTGSAKNEYKLSTLAGHLEIHALAYSLYSPIRLALQLLRDDGTPVKAELTQPAFEGGSGYTNYDAVLVADGLSPGDYVLQASGEALDASLYPAGPVSLDSVPFLVVTGSANPGRPPLASTLAQNPRCENVETFTAYNSPPGNPPRNPANGTPAGNNGGGGGVGFCGPVERPENGPGAVSRSAMAGWLLPWLAMLLISLAPRLRLRLSSGA